MSFLLFLSVVYTNFYFLISFFSSNLILIVLKMMTMKDMTTACKVIFLLFALFSSIDLCKRYAGKLSNLVFPCLACFAI